jgi:hypothetical protein
LASSFDLCAYYQTFRLSHIKTALAHRSAILRRSQEAEDTCTKQTAEAHLYDDDVKMVREHKLKSKLHTAAEKDEAVAKYESGLSMAAVAKLYGVLVHFRYFHLSSQNAEYCSSPAHNRMACV